MHDDGHTERLLPEPPLTAKSKIKEIDNRGHVIGVVKTDADGFARRLEAGKGSVDIKLKRRRHITRNHRPHAIMNIVSMVEHPHQPVEISQRRIPIRPGISLIAISVEHLHRRTTRADMHPLPPPISRPLFST